MIDGIQEGKVLSSFLVYLPVTTSGFCSTKVASESQSYHTGHLKAGLARKRLLVFFTICLH